MLSDQHFLQIETGLANEGYAVIRDMFSFDYCTRVREEIADLDRAGETQPAKIGKGSFHQLEREVRGDRTHWFDPLNLTPVQSELWGVLEELKVMINASFFLGLWDLEGHYAVYPPGAFYRMHLDRFQNDSKRTLTVVAFFNPNWLPSDGGCLRMETKSGPLEVLPEAGTCVFFLSDRIRHEVTETNRERFSFAGWFRTRE